MAQSPNVRLVTEAALATAFTNFMTAHPNLSDLDGLSFLADKVVYANGTGTLALADFTAAGRALVDDANASAQLTTLGVSTFVKTLLDDADGSAFLTTLGFTTFFKTLIDDADASGVMSTLGFSTFFKTLVDDADASAVLSTLGVTTFVKTILDDTSAGAVLTTLGVSAFAQTILDDAAATNVLTTLGFSTFFKTLVDDTDASTVMSTLGFSTFFKTLVDDADAAAVRATLGIVQTVVWSSETATTGTTADNRAYVARTVTEAHLRVGSAPVGSALTVVLQHWNGTTWSTITTLTVADGATADHDITGLTQAQSAGHKLRLNVTSVGSTTPAGDVVVEVITV